MYLNGAIVEIENPHGMCSATFIDNLLKIVDNCFQITFAFTYFFQERIAIYKNMKLYYLGVFRMHYNFKKKFIFIYFFMRFKFVFCFKRMKTI